MQGDRYLVVLPVTAVLGVAAAVLFAPAVRVNDYAAEGRRWWSYVMNLADDKLEGRNTGSAGHRMAAEYIAGEFERSHLKPAGTKSYFQPVPFETRQIDESKSSLELVRGGRVEKLELGEDANLGLRGDPRPHTDAPAIFVGYGLQVPELNYDDLAGLDLHGKIAVILQGAPSFMPPPLAAHMQSAERWKRLRAAGAIGLAGFSDPKHTDVPWARSTLARLQPSMVLRDPQLSESQAGMQISVRINPVHLDKWFAGTGHTAAEIFELAAANKPLPKFPLKVKVRAAIAYGSSQISSDNVAGVLTGSDPALKNEYVVVSAHLDHLGIGAPRSTATAFTTAQWTTAPAWPPFWTWPSLHESGAEDETLPSVPRRHRGGEGAELGSKYFAHASHGGCDEDRSPTEHGHVPAVVPHAQRDRAGAEGVGFRRPGPRGGACNRDPDRRATVNRSGTSSCAAISTASFASGVPPSLSRSARARYLGKRRS